MVLFRGCCLLYYGRSVHLHSMSPRGRKTKNRAGKKSLGEGGGTEIIKLDELLPNKMSLAKPARCDAEYGIQ